jgi:DNA repair protein RecN (Recombination protein N)
MLHQLHIHNYAIIVDLHVRFSNHLNIITGETGAGKSILMGALSLILGERADTSVLLNKEKKCFIEGIFKTNHKAVDNFLRKNELDHEEEIIIRREISSSGKSRAFINDTPVTLAQLKQLSSLLVDLHQQFDTLELNNNDFQRQVIDALAGNGKLIDQYQTVYKSYRSAIKELEKLSEEQAIANKEFDYNQFLFNELDEINLKENELEETESEIKIMSNAENIKQVLSEIYYQMEESEQPLVQQIKSINHKLQSLANVFPEVEILNARLDSVQIEMQDIAGELDVLSNRIYYDPEKINTLNERMAQGYALLKKHNVQTTAELIEIKNELAARLECLTQE